METIDADASPRLAQRCDVRSLPTLISFAGGRELGRTVGAMTREKLLERLKL